MNIVFVGDIGTEISLDCGVDVSSATVRGIAIRKPDGGKVLWSATADTTTSIKHTTVSGDLNIPGVWKLQALITMPGWSGTGDVALLTVVRPL